MTDERTRYLRYLGVLGLLCEASVYVPEDIRESMETVLEHACEDGKLKWKRVLDRLEIEANPTTNEQEQQNANPNQ